MLVEKFKDNQEIAMYHMESKIRSDTDDIIFLYNFIPGICPKSYALNVAKLAGIQVLFCS
jgi:DNA mismatch repair protein MSH6